jgi:hypothetical protein
MRPTATQVKACWDAIRNPNARIVAEAMVKEGFEISYRTVARYKEKDWAEPVNKVKTKPTKQAAVSIKNLVKAQVTSNPDLAHRILTAVEPTVDVRIARVQQLALQSLATNQATLQQTSVITAIVVAEELQAVIGSLIVANAGDVARLLNAITEAGQVKHVGGTNQVPERGDDRVIDVVPLTKNGVSEALSRFRKTAGLKAG